MKFWLNFLKETAYSSLSWLDEISSFAQKYSEKSEFTGLAYVESWRLKDHHKGNKNIVIRPKFAMLDTQVYCHISLQ